MIDVIIDWIHETASHKEYSFVDASEAIDKRIGSLKKEEILELVEEIHVIPEAFGHDSSEEKIYAKASDSIVARALAQLGLTTRVLSERGDAADVIGQSSQHGYSFVADSKVFRLSRTAKNQKDFKVDSMNAWRGDCDYAVVVCPYYQYPSTKSAIYKKSVSYNVGLLGFEHIGFLLRSDVCENKDVSFERLFGHPAELQRELSVAESSRASHSRAKLRDTVLEITGEKPGDLGDYIAHFHSKLGGRAQQEIAFWESEMERIRGLSHEEAIDALIDARKIRSKIATIQAFLAGD